MTDPSWMTKQEAAAYLRVSTKTIDRRVREGLLTKHYPGGAAGSPRFRRDELDALMKPVADAA